MPIELIKRSFHTMTKAQALAKQAEQIAWCSKTWPNVAEIVAKATTADQLEDGVEYDTATINRHIPRGAAIEWLMGSNPDYD